MGNKESAGVRGPPPARAGGGNQDIVNAVATQKEAVGNLDKKIQQLEMRATQERELAKKSLQSKTDKARNQAKAKRHLTNANRLKAQITKFEGMRDNLEELQSAMTQASMAKDVHNAMSVANSTMKNITKSLNPDQMQDLVDEIGETTQNVNDAIDLIGQPISADPGLELDVMNDMEELMRETADEEEAEATPVKTKKPAPKIPSLPTAPTTKVVMNTEDEDVDEQLSALMRDMN